MFDRWTLLQDQDQDWFWLLAVPLAMVFTALMLLLLAPVVLLSWIPWKVEALRKKNLTDRTD
jgi:hypothetical protein